MNAKALKKMVAVILIFILPIITSGCWNRRELNTIAIVGVIGIDLEDDNYKLTFEITKPSTPGGGGDEGKPVRHVQGTGRTMFEAARNVLLKFERRTFYPHVEMFIIGEEVAKKGLTSYMDLIFRDHEFRLHTLMFIAKGTTAADVMGIAAGVEDAPVRYLEDLANQKGATSKMENVTVLTFLKKYLGDGIHPVVGILQKVKKTKVTKDDEEYELLGEGTAVFKKDKLTGYLNGLETRGYNWITGGVRSGILMVDNPTGVGKTAVEIVRTQAKREAQMVDGTFKIKVTINMTGTLGEEPGIVDLKDVKTIKELEKLTAEKIKQEMEMALRIAQQEYRTDIFGFGVAVHQKYPEEWKKIKKKWDDEYFPNTEVEMDVKVNISKMGKTTAPFMK